MPAMPRPTLTDVARLAGVSRFSAGDILAGKEDRFRSETVQAVRDAAKTMGYRPHGAGLALRTGRTGFIGFVQDRYIYRTALSADLLVAVEARLSAKHLKLVYAALAEDTDAPELLRHIVADGFLINYHAAVPPALERATSGSRVPAVYLNIRRPAACVYHDEQAAAQALTHYCFRQWGSVGWVDRGPATAADRRAEPHHSLADRLEGYSTACAAVGRLPLQFRTVYGSRTPPLVDQFIDLFRRSGRPRCLIIGDGTAASIHAHTAAARCGLRVPEDLALASFGHALIDDLGWNMPMAIQRWDHLGQTAVDLLVGALDTHEAEVPAIAIPLDLHW